MIIEIDFNSDEAIYVQLCNQIIMGIATDQLKDGETLPSVRQLADTIGINMHTVNKAYSVLKQEGFLTIDRRKGAVISIDADKMRALEEMKQELQWFKEHGFQLKVLDHPTTMIQLEDGQEWIREMVNNILIEVLSSIAQEERNTIRRRQREGIEAAKKAGVRFGAPEKGFPEEWESYYYRYKTGELTRKYVLEKLGISADRFKYLKKKYEQAKKGE